MKKYVSITLLFLYLVSTIGINISIHYCGDQLADVAVITETNCCCDDDGKVDDCCKNEYKTFKIHDDQNKVELAEKKLNNIAVSAFPTFVFDSHDNPKTQHNPLLACLPRPPNKVSVIPAYKRNHSFLFYG